MATNDRGTGRPRPQPQRPSGRGRPTVDEPATEETHRPKPQVTVETHHGGRVVDELVNNPEKEFTRDGMHARHAKVRVGGSVTRNMGDFNSVRVHVEVEMPCEPNWDEVDITYRKVSDYVDECLQEEMRLATGAE